MPTKYSIEDAPAQTKYTIEDEAAPAPPPSIDDRNGFQKFADEIQAYVEHPEQRGAGQPSAANRFGGGVMESTLGVLAHPVKTAEGMFKSNFGPPEDTGILGVAEAVGGPGARQLISTAKSFREDPARAAGDIVGGIALGEAAGEVVGPVARGLTKKVAAAREGVRTGTQSLMGAGSRAVKGEVVEAGDTAKTTDEAHLEKTQNSLHETEGKELKHQQDVKAAKETAERESKEQTAKQIAARNQAIEDRRAAEEKLTAEKLKQGKISPAQAKLQSAWRDLRARVETAREKALKVGNQKYNAVNEELNPLTADMEKVHEAYQNASDSIGDTQNEPALLNRLGKSLQRGDALTYKDLQSVYSELGKELSKGTLPGNIYHAYDVLQEGVGEDMQRMADSKDMGGQLYDARNYWRRMKQTFGKPLSFGDAASKVIKGDSAAEDALQNQMRMLGSFDPDIPKQYNYVQDVEKGVDALPKPTSERVLNEKADLPAVPPRGRPVAVEPQPVAAPERTPLPDRPEPTSVDTRATRERLVDKWASGESSLNKWQVRALLSGGLSAVIDGVGLLGGHAPGLGSMVLEAGGTAAYTFGPAMVAKLLENPGFREWITRPPVGELDTLRKLPNADRIQITDGLKPVIQQAQAQGIKVNPELAALVGAGATIGPKAQKLQQAADEYRSNPPARSRARFALVATNAAGHRIGSNDNGKTWIDVETGQQVR